mmetsp:Transcript_2945/g.10521  ORF Transcript_2945/g.10521 Transcript_2945/m.10521 type:complete len:212 (+) Transcript_2945:1198-1833(+)
MTLRARPAPPDAAAAAGAAAAAAATVAAVVVTSAALPGPHGRALGGRHVAARERVQGVLRQLRAVAADHDVVRRLLRGVAGGDGGGAAADDAANDATDESLDAWLLRVAKLRDAGKRAAVASALEEEGVEDVEDAAELLAAGAVRVVRAAVEARVKGVKLVKLRNALCAAAGVATTAVPVPDEVASGGDGHSDYVGDLAGIKIDVGSINNR